MGIGDGTLPIVLITEKIVWPTPTEDGLVCEDCEPAMEDTAGGDDVGVKIEVVIVGVGLVFVTASVVL